MPNENQSREDLYRTARAEYGKALDRLAAGYEADRDRRLDLRQEIHMQIWRSLAVFDGRCSLRTWVLRVAHNAAASYVQKEARFNTRFLSLEELDAPAAPFQPELDVDRGRALEHLFRMILALKPLDRQIMISYLEDLDAASIAEITGLSASNIAMKVHRIKNILSRRLHQELHHG